MIRQITGIKEGKNKGLYMNGTAAAGVAEDVLVCAWRSAVLRRRVGG